MRSRLSPAGANVQHIHYGDPRAVLQKELFETKHRENDSCKQK